MSFSVVVTGIGLVTPLGNKIEEFWRHVSQGIPAGFSIDKNIEGCDRFVHFALLAAQSAITDSGLSPQLLKDAGVTISSSKGGIAYALEKEPHLGMYPHTAMQRCVKQFGCRGPCVNVISACATGLDSIIMGANFIKTGRAGVVLAGGTDACLTEFILSAYRKLGVLADGLCMPYNKKRSGFSLSEGAGVVVLEEKENAVKRQTRIYGEITGWANLSDGYHITSLDPSGETIARAIKTACKKKEEVDYINTHGTGTIENDIIETQALVKAFGRKAYNIPMSSTKAVTGHMLGASGAIEFITGLLAMKENFVPPTANLTEPDPMCDLDYVPVHGRSHNIKKFLTLSYGFGGHVSAMEVSRI